MIGVFGARGGGKFDSRASGRFFFRGGGESVAHGGGGSVSVDGGVAVAGDCGGSVPDDVGSSRTGDGSGSVASSNKNGTTAAARLEECSGQGGRGSEQLPSLERARSQVLCLTKARDDVHTSLIHGNLHELIETM